MDCAVLVIGVGNAMRADDGVGLEVIGRLVGEDGFAVRAYGGEPVGLLDLWVGCESVVIVDAVHSGAPPGTIHRLAASTHPIPATLRTTSTHALGVAETIELARAMDSLPETVVFYGVEGADFTAGAPMSREVLGAIDRLVETVRAEARDLAAYAQVTRSDSIAAATSEG